MSLSTRVERLEESADLKEAVLVFRSENETEEQAGRRWRANDPGRADRPITLIQWLPSQ